jgi:hypothetical protein
MVAHGVRADSDPVASSGMDGKFQSFSSKVEEERTVMPEEVGPDDLLRISCNLRTPSSVHRCRQQWKIARTCLEEYRCRCNILCFRFLIPLFLHVICVIDDLFHKSGVFRTRPFPERLEFFAMIDCMKICYIIMAGYSE